MGRYYSGDIEGIFVLGVQSSDDASFFGGSTIEPQTIQYEFTLDDLDTITKGIAVCTEKLGGYRKKLDDFFATVNGYTTKQLEKYLDMPESESNNLLEWYARLTLGEQIRDCVNKKGSCTFEAEL